MSDHPGEKEKPKESEEITVSLTPVGDPKMGRVYVNFAQVSHSPWEFTIRFCLAPAGADIKKSLKEDETVETPVIIDIMLSPALIPGLIKALETNYGRFEKKLDKGMITVPKSTTH